MNDDISFVKIFRKIVNWQWYTDIPTKVLFIHLLITANHSAQEWRNITIPIGGKITSLNHLSSETGLTIKQVRTSLNKLEKSGEVDKQTTNRYTLITLINYTFYNDNSSEKTIKGQTKGIQKTNEGHSKDNQRATNKNVKNVKNVKNEDNVKKYIYGEYRHVKLTDKQKNDFIEKYDNVIFDKSVKLLDEYKETSGKTYKNDYLVMCKWVVERVREEIQQENKITTSNLNIDFSDF